jgi:CBS domain-containing protein
LPAVSYTAVPIQLGLIFALVKIKKTSKSQSLILVILPNLFLLVWGSLAFQSPISWLQTIVGRSRSRIMVADVNGDSVGYFASLANLSKSLILSFGFISLILIFLFSIFIKNHKILRGNFTENQIFIVIAFTSALEFLIFPGHAFIYSFAQIMLIPILWVFGLILLMDLLKAMKKENYRYFFVVILLLCITAFVNYGVTKIIYNPVQSYDVVTGEGLKTYQYEHT